MLGCNWALAYCHSIPVPDVAKAKAELKDPPCISLSNGYVLREYNFSSLLSSITTVTKALQGRRAQ